MSAAPGFSSPSELIVGIMGKRPAIFGLILRVVIGWKSMEV